jgi:ABC-2 type transport system permease protein
MPSPPLPDVVPSRWRRIGIQARYDTRLTMANGEQILLTLLIPVGVLLGLTYVPGLIVRPPGTDPLLTPVDLAVPGAVAVAVLSSAFASLAIGTGFDRRSRSLLLLATTPLSRVELVWARALSTVGIVLGQVIVIGVIAAALGWRPDSRWVWLVMLIILGALSLAACAVMTAGLLRAEATLALANGIFLVLLVAGGTAIPVSSLPGWWAAIASALPSGALAEGLRWGALGLDGLPVIPVITLIIWGIIASAIARVTFRWD